MKCRIACDLPSARFASGYILLVAMLLTWGMTVASLVAVDSAQLNQRMSHNLQSQQQAFQNAEAGRLAVARLMRDSCLAGRCDNAAMASSWLSYAGSEHDPLAAHTDESLANQATLVADFYYGASRAAAPSHGQQVPEPTAGGACEHDACVYVVPVAAGYLEIRSLGTDAQGGVSITASEYVY